MEWRYTQKENTHGQGTYKEGKQREDIHGKIIDGKEIYRVGVYMEKRYL